MVAIEKPRNNTRSECVVEMVGRRNTSLGHERAEQWLWAMKKLNIERNGVWCATSSMERESEICKQ